ncbi:hypothetical protein A0H81_14052 [Grifola frondosa]|uniref:Secreted protein n=1 Tax=Grifola frondosa TaxID=5627 RepID=A0A1C7LMR3_GRIFR|nr:hypothetical protein A0H81_14052 [Grifola frondosa]
MHICWSTWSTMMCLTFVSGEYPGTRRMSMMTRSLVVTLPNPSELCELWTHATVFGPRIHPIVFNSNVPLILRMASMTHSGDAGSERDMHTSWWWLMHGSSIDMYPSAVACASDEPLIWTLKNSACSAREGYQPHHLQIRSLARNAMCRDFAVVFNAAAYRVLEG